MSTREKPAEIALRDAMEGARRVRTLEMDLRRATARRDDAIVRAARFGISLRKIAAETRLSFGRIGQLVRRHGGA